MMNPDSEMDQSAFFEQFPASFSVCPFSSSSRVSL
ncbi:hypothetical protein F383_10411 [Gossypium arboreum]|uniref:Uncharacterized protein n=1 Tax=Gossypium arboreum TaxID=29729 RepID=A0A0B0P9H3_GOSAR|nr:hypothetical protein F383_10411 [Gossypium arboreum]